LFKEKEFLYPLMLLLCFSSLILKPKGIERRLIKVIIQSIILSLNTIFTSRKLVKEIQFNPLIIMPDMIVAKDQVAAFRDKA
tara:strand:- start:192 stop:437 length:246 start_codon:yes stop_codon:yes gene_type:complete